MKRNLFNAAVLLTFAMLITSLASCNRGKNSATAEDLPPGTHVVSVIEVIQTSNYTYLQVFENNEKYWIAVTARESKEGEVLYFSNSMEMKDFKSKELNRTFPSVLFVQDISETPPSVDQTAKTTGKRPVQKLDNIAVEPADGGITIADLFKNKAGFADKKVKIRGVVVKYNENIMNKNWAHIQDGTENGENFDLTVTTKDVVADGSTVTFEGIIRLDKDFGSGYAYDVIMEDAKALDVKTDTEL